MTKELHDFVLGSGHGIGRVAETDSHSLNRLFYFILGDLALSDIKELDSSIHWRCNDFPLSRDDIRDRVFEGFDGFNWRVGIGSIVPAFDGGIIAATDL